VSELHVVFGAGGSAGGAVVRELAARGKAVRAVTRSGRADVPPGVENARADATDVASARAACAGAAVVYHCVNVPYSEWYTTLPRVMDALIAAAADAGAILVCCDNLYMYGRVNRPLMEDLPYAATTRKGQLRARLANHLLEEHVAGRVRATIGRGSDFYGPGAANSVPGQLVFPAVVAGKRAHWVGSLDQPHTLSYVDDFARGLITLGASERALGEVWHIPAAPALTGRQFIELAFHVAGLRPKVGVYRRWMVTLVALFDRQMREFLEMLYQFESPFVVDASKFERAFGDLAVTPHRDAIARTLAWQRARQERAAGARGLSGQVPKQA
jgi:nucleoside-diphosphate-sugar epimerase